MVWERREAKLAEVIATGQEDARTRRQILFGERATGTIVARRGSELTISIARDGGPPGFGGK
jgi:hypothetical protein